MRASRKSNAGMTDEEIHRIAEGPDSAGLDRFRAHAAAHGRRAALRHDDQRRDVARAAHEVFSDQQMMEALFTAAQYQLVSMALNSLGVQLDPGLRDRLPKDLRLPQLRDAATVAATLNNRASSRLSRSNGRQSNASWSTPQIQRRERAESLRDYAQPSGPVRAARVVRQLPATRIAAAAEDARAAHHAHGVADRRRIRMGASRRARAQTAGLTDEEIAESPTGRTPPGWSEETRAVLRAADELRREAFISDRTWTTLAKYYDTQATHRDHLHGAAATR